MHWINPRFDSGELIRGVGYWRGKGTCNNMGVVFGRVPLDFTSSAFWVVVIKDLFCLSEVALCVLNLSYIIIYVNIIQNKIRL